MKLESRPTNSNRWRTDQQAGVFHGQAGVGSARARDDVVLAFHGGETAQLHRDERTYRLLLSRDEAQQLRVALEGALATLNERDEDAENARRSRARATWDEIRQRAVDAQREGGGR